MPTFGGHHSLTMHASARMAQLLNLDNLCRGGLAVADKLINREDLIFKIMNRFHILTTYYRYNISKSLTHTPRYEVAVTANSKQC